MPTVKNGKEGEGLLPSSLKKLMAALYAKKSLKKQCSIAQEVLVHKRGNARAGRGSGFKEEDEKKGFKLGGRASRSWQRK